MDRNPLRIFTLLVVLGLFFSVTISAAAQDASRLRAGPLKETGALDVNSCSSGAHTLSSFGARVYPEMGNGGYTSVHSDIYIVYDAATNMFLPGTHVDLTQQATQCLTDFSLDFERTSANATDGPNMTVNSVTVDGQPATFTFVQPTYPGDPNGQNDPDPLAHAVSNVNPVSATNPNPPACSPQVSGNTQNGAQCPANKLVVTPASPIASGATYVVTVNYTGRPGVYNDGDGTTEGWFRSNNPAGDGAFVTTEPVGSMAWMPLNNHPSAKPTIDVYDTVNTGKTAISAGELVSNQTNPPDANFPGGSVTWHWHSPERVASYLLTNSIGSFDLSQQTLNGIKYYWAVPSSISATRKTSDKVVTDQQPGITQFQAQFNGPFPFTSNGVIIGLPSASFAEEMQTKITFPGGATSTPSVGTLNHENMHQWFGDNVSEAAFNLTFWKEGWATVGEYLNTARTAATSAGGLGTPAGNAAFDTSLVNRFNTNYGTTSGSFWTVAPSNPTVGNLFTTANTYTRPGTAYLALRQILDSSMSRPDSDRWVGAMKQIQSQYGGGTITEAQLEAVFHQWLPSQSAACSAKLDTFFTQWFDTPYPTPNNATNKPQITGPGINGPDHFYDDASLCTRADQTISFGPLANKTYLDADFAVSATADSGLAVTFSATGNCSMVSGKVHLTGAGSCTVTASQAGDAVFKAALDVLQSFDIASADQTIDFAPLADKTFADAPFQVSATASSGLAVSFAASGNCTISGNTVSLTGVGSCTITASQPGDANYNAAPDVPQSFNITAAVTSLAIFVDPASAQYSDPRTLTANLSPASANGDAATGTVEFFVDGTSVGSSDLDSSGTATLTLPGTYAPGAYDVTASFTSSNANFGDSSGGPATATVTEEDARANYNGNSLFWTSSVNSTNADATLSATIRDITAVSGDPAYDADAGDIRYATVSFIDRDTNTVFPGCSNLPIGLVDGNDPTTGTAVCNTTLSVSGSSGGTQYTVGIIVSGYYTRNSSDDNTIVAVAQPLASNFITGGGHLTLTNPSGKLAASPGSKANFGLNVKYNKKGTNLQGNASILVRGAGHVYQIKATALSSLGVNGSHADLTSKANIQDITDPLHPVSVDGNATLQMWLTDNGSPGTNDTLGIQVLNKNGGTWFSSNWNGTKTVEQKLAGGNIAVR